MELPLLIGLQKTSLADYPGKVAFVLFLPGCNLRCSYCHNSDLALGRTEGLTDRNKVIDFVKNRAPLLGGVVISGGEPLLHKGISELIAVLKAETGLPVKIDTNGLLPDRLETLLSSQGRPDYIAMDIKTIPSNYSSFAFTENTEQILKRSIALIKQSGIDYQFRTTVHPDFIRMDMVEELSELIEGSRDYVLNPFMPGDCLNPAFNSHPSATAEELLSLRDAFTSRGIKCRVPSVQNCCNTL